MKRYDPYHFTKFSKQYIKDLILQKKYLKRFNNYISITNDILAYDFTTSENKFRLNAINKLIRVLSLDIQNTTLNHTLDGDRAYEFDPIIDNNQLRCPKCFEIHHYEKNLQKPDTPIPFDISNHPTLSFPWDTQRLIKALGNIGVIVDNPFLFDENNHFESTLILPINLLVLGNGFHSSTSGIYDTNAIYYPDYILDISDWYNEIIFDGTFFRHKKCNSILESPENKSIGIIYEIGRILVKHNLSLGSLHLQNKNFKLLSLS